MDMAAPSLGPSQTIWLVRLITGEIVIGREAIAANDDSIRLYKPHVVVQQVRGQEIMTGLVPFLYQLTAPSSGNCVTLYADAMSTPMMEASDDLANLWRQQSSGIAIARGTS